MEKEFQHLKNTRKKLISLLVFSNLIIIFIIFVFAILQYPAFLFLSVLVFAVLNVIIGVKIYQSSLIFKRNILGKIFKDLNETFEFDPKKVIDKELVYSSKVLTKNQGNRFDCSDVLEGVIDNFQFTSCDLYIYYVTSNGKSTQNVTVFRGRFYIININKNINSHLVVREEGNILKSTPKGLSLVQTESMEFDKKFNLYSDSPLDAFKNIKPQQIIRLIELEKEYNGKLLFSIKDDTMYFGFWDNANRFELRQYETFEDAKAACVEEINFIKKIINIIS